MESTLKLYKQLILFVVVVVVVAGVFKKKTGLKQVNSHVWILDLFFHLEYDSI